MASFVPMQIPFSRSRKFGNKGSDIEVCRHGVSSVSLVQGRRLFASCNLSSPATNGEDKIEKSTSGISYSATSGHYGTDATVDSHHENATGDSSLLDLSRSSQSSTRRYQYVSWEDVEGMCKVLVEKLKGRHFDLVLAVTRGGMVPATMLAQALELRNLVTATVIFYTDGGDQFFGMAEPRFLSFPSADSIAGQHVLIVDDVWDSGRTASAVRKRALVACAKSVTLTVLHYKPTQTVVKDVFPDFYAEDTENWVVYPWERISPHHAADSVRN